MPGRRGTATAMLGTLISVLVLTACGSPQPSAGALARDAVRAFDAAPLKTIQGSFVDGVIPVSVKLTVASNGDASGSGTFDHFPLAYVQGPKSTFVQGTRYWAWERLTQWQVWTGLGQTWVETTAADPATNAFQLGARATGLVARLDSDRGQVRMRTARGPHGQNVDELTDGSITYEVGDAAPHRLLAVRDAAERVGDTVLSRARFSFTYGGRSPQAGPAAGQYVNPDDPRTLPAEYDVSTVSWAGPCQNDACTVAVTVKDEAGAPIGQSVVTVTVTDWPDLSTALASCQVPIPTIGYHASTTVACTAGGPQLKAWFQGGGRVGTWAAISNPPYWT